MANHSNPNKEAYIAMRKKRKMNKKGTAALYIYFMILAIIIVVIAAVLAPMGVQFNSKMYVYGERMMLDAQEDIANISDPTMRASINDSINEALGDIDTNIEVNANLFQYGWILIIAVVGLVVFLYSRRLVEYGGGLV